MTGSLGPQHNPRALQDEAATSAVRDAGPTADRYDNALLRYLQALTRDHSADTPHPARPPATLVGDVMTETVVAAHQDAVFKEIVAALARNKIRAVPVIDDIRKVIGVVTASDLLHHLVEWRSHRLPCRLIPRRRRTRRLPPN